MNNLIKWKYYVQQLEKLCGEHIIKVITGLRRSGKSVLMEMFVGQLKESGVSGDCVFRCTISKSRCIRKMRTGMTSIVIFWNIPKANQ
jgi:predicted AAA+ superfamily ATPase